MCLAVLRRCSYFGGSGHAAQLLHRQCMFLAAFLNSVVCTRAYCLLPCLPCCSLSRLVCINCLATATAVITAVAAAAVTVAVASAVTSVHKLAEPCAAAFNGCHDMCC